MKCCRFVANVLFPAVLALLVSLPVSLPAMAGDPKPSGPVDFGGVPNQLAPDPAKTHTNPDGSADANRYGLFGLLDHRSVVGTGYYPEPFLVDEGDVDREFALSWVHQEGHHAVSDDATAEIEWSFGQLTIEVEAPYVREYSNTTDPATGIKTADTEEGIGSPSIAFRHPIWEWVSSDGTVDNAVMPAIEVAFPSNSRVGKTTEIVPGVFDLLRVGDHFGMQTHVGYSTLYGGDENNVQTLEYSVDFSYNLDAGNLPLPSHVVGLVPIFEFAGERPLNKGDSTNSLTGVIGGRINLESFGPAAPRFGVGYVFPIDKGARDDFSWGVVVSLVFDL